MRNSIITTSYLIILFLGIIAIILPKHLPDKFMLPDKNRFFIKSSNGYRKLKEKQFLILGIYYIVISISNLIIVINPIINSMLLFLIPFIVINKMESKLKRLYSKK